MAKIAIDNDPQGGENRAVGEVIRITKGSRPQVLASATWRPITQREVAEKAGVSQAAASYALAGSVTKVSPATRERVLRAAAELGYQPNLLARGLRGVGTGLLGIIVRDISAAASAEVCRALLHRAPAVGYDMLLTDAADSAKTLLRLAGIMKSKLCEGLILVGELPDQDVLWEEYEKLGVPTVALLQGARDLPITKVAVDNATGIKLALDHLVALGHTRIGYVAAEWMHGLHDRLEAFKELSRHMGLVARDTDIVCQEFSREGGAEALRSFLTKESLPSAVMVATDLMASGFLREALRQGLQIPKDLSVVGFDDITEASLTYPALTTIRQPFGEMAAAALVCFAEQKSSAGMQSDIILSPTLTVRESTTTPASRSACRQLEVEVAHK